MQFLREFIITVPASPHVNLGHQEQEEHRDSKYRDRKAQDQERGRNQACKDCNRHGNPAQQEQYEQRNAERREGETQEKDSKPKEEQHTANNVYSGLGP